MDLKKRKFIIDLVRWMELGWGYSINGYGYDALFAKLPTELTTKHEYSFNSFCGVDK